MIAVAHHTDPGCPWAWSAAPQHAVLHWRFGGQLDWRLVCIGLAERAADYDARGYRPVSGAVGYLRRFGPRGMPFDLQPRARNQGTGRACRAIVATRLLAPGRDLEAFRALQVARFTTTALFDDDDGIAQALATVPDLDVPAVLAALDDDATEAAYQADRALARSAAGSPTEAQNRSARTDGPIRYTAPSLIFTAPDGRVLEAGGFQHIDAYDLCLANLDPGLDRRPPAEDPVEVLRAFPYPLTTREVAAVMAPHLTDPDDVATEEALIGAAATGAVRRRSAGTGAFWHLAAPGGG